MMFKISYVKGVSLPPPEATAHGDLMPFFIKHSVFRKGGIVGDIASIVDSVFEEKVQVPDNTVIIDSHIYNASIAERSDRQDKLLYRYRPGPSQTTDFKGGLAQSTMYFADGTHITGSRQIRINEPWDDYLNLLNNISLTNTNSAHDQQ